MNQKRVKILISILLFITPLGYILDNYTYVNDEVGSVLISMNPVDYDPNIILYTANKNEVDINFGKVYNPEKLNDSTWVVRFDDPQKLRKLRIYFQSCVHDLRLHSVKVVNEKDTLGLDKSKFITGNRLNLSQSDGSNYSLKSSEKNGYIEYKAFLFNNDLVSIALGLIVALFLSLLSYLALPKMKTEDLPRFDLGKLSMVIFILTIYLPHPFFNITLIVALLLNLKNFRLKSLVSNWPSILFLLLFLCIFLNDIFVSSEGFHNLRATEKGLPFIALPFLFASIKPHNYLKYFLIMAVIMGSWFSLTSLLDILIYRNIEILSFNLFTKHIHPVYFSYLLAVAIFYCQLHIRKNYKYLIITFLGICLILSGSKAIISITFICFLLFIGSYKLKLLSVAGLFTLVLLFEPVQTRFQKILDLTDLSILNEEFIEDPRDERINGLTFRLILWQETLKINQGLTEVLFGVGVGPTASKELSEDILKRGLIEHTSYSTHNQYLTTYWRMGLIGLIVLLSLITGLITLSIKTKNKMLLIVTLILIIAMLTETVFGRVNGIYFFTAIILTLSDKQFSLE